MPALTGKVALVTGGSRGIGRAICERLAREGARVVFSYLQASSEATEVVTGIEKNGGQATALQADLGRLEDIHHLFQTTIEQCGRLDIFVSNAAAVTAQSFLDVSEEEFDRIFNVNAKGVFFALQEAARRVTDGGRIINISTGATKMRAPGISTYVASKAAGEQFAKSLALEIASRGVTVNSVSPGHTDTDAVPRDQATRQARAAGSVFNRLGEPDEIANVVVFLAGEEARWITGENIQAGGGLVM